MSEILICTGPVKSGKTTLLMQWATTHKSIDGIFQPVIDEKRFLYHIGSRTLKALETNSEMNTFIIGNYRFSNESFDWAKNLLLDCFEKEIDWLIIDEVGPLELEGKGLEPAVSKILNERARLKCMIICVVREKLLDQFLIHYKLNNSYKIFNAAQI
ncbi:MAG: nucleoside-triphosphatase [Melioribacteraceae bacterium]|jgi:nucleoside-triphosphatase THEP1|nr:nucleoside-triphosphatase [Melioribacteraceae bacterium]